MKNKGYIYDIMYKKHHTLIHQFIYFLWGVLEVVILLH
jgi:hypothetical protein